MEGVSSAVVRSYAFKKVASQSSAESERTVWLCNIAHQYQSSLDC